MLRRAGMLVAGGSVAGGAYAYKWARDELGDDGIIRIWTYDKVALPAICDYKICEFRNEKLPKLLPMLFAEVPEAELTKRYAALHHKWKQPLYDVFMQLGGFYYKSGQKVASNMGGYVPSIYQELFQPFLNDIPARDEASVRAVIEEELGRPMEDVFSSFTWRPIGCASIGQAHRATLRKSGERVVVKVQNPEAERTFKGDVLCLRVLVDIFLPQLSPAFAEIEKQFATEFDYRGECANAQEVRSNLIKAGFSSVVVPALHAELCSKRLMVMQEIHPSIPLHTALDQQAEKLARSRGISKAAFIEAEKARVEEETRVAARTGRLQRQLSMNTYDRYIRVQRTRRTAWRAWQHTFNGTLGWLVGKYDMSEAADSVIVPINAAKMISDLLYVTGHEVLIDGCFNADPHPGNILYLADTQQLGLIDYGQVKRLTDAQRVGLATSVLLVAAAFSHEPRENPKADPTAHERARASIAAHSIRMGMKTERMLPETLYEMNMTYFGRMDPLWFYPKNLIQWSDAIQKKDALGNLDEIDFLVMVNTASMMIRGLGEMLQQSRNLATAWKPLAEQVLRDAGKLGEVEAEIASWTK